MCAGAGKAEIEFPPKVSFPFEGFGQFWLKPKFSYGELGSCSLGDRSHMCTGGEWAHVEGSGRLGRQHS